MTSKLNPYPVMKPSGLEWLGDVPDHWQVKRAKTVLQAIDNRSQTGNEQLLTVSSRNGVVLRASADVTMFKAASYVGHKLCAPNDLVINCLWAWAQGLGVSPHHGIVSTAYGVYRLSRGAACNPRYIHNLVRSTPFQWELQVRSKGIWISRLQLTDEAFLGAPVPIPPLDEQAAIVRYLDHADRRIQRYIRAKEKLIRLLEEQKQAIIQQAVTRGLEPDVQLKPSGLGQIGDVPEHWDVRPLMHIGKLSKTNGGSKADETSTGVPCVRYGDLYTTHDYLIKQARSCVSPSNSNEYTDLCPGDVLFAASGESIDEIGKSAVNLIQDDCVCGGDIVLLRPKKEVDPHYLGYATSSISSLAQKAQMGRGVTIMHIYASTLKRLAIALPPLLEQTAIADHLNLAQATIDMAIDHSRRQIALLKEYQERLIADVVTGKLNVNEAAATLPEPEYGSTEDASGSDEEAKVELHEPIEEVVS